MARLRFTILGCGSSGGVPRLGPQWGACDPNEPRNRRRRCSLLVERIGGEGTTRVLIDTTPDMRSQLLDAGVGVLDAVVFTHSHADHTHGIDDLRQIVFNTRKRLPVWADGDTTESLLSRFGYAFAQPEGSLYHPICDLHAIPEHRSFHIMGPGGAIAFMPFRVSHGPTEALGFRIGGLAYLPDVAQMYDTAWPVLEDLEVFVVDALRYEPHPTHSHLARTLEWIARAGPRRAIITNMHVDLDYATLRAELPAGVEPAHDGLIVEIEG